MFDDGGDRSRRDDWRADGYTWRNYGKREYNSSGKRIERSFFKICNKGEVSGKFQKHAFRFLDSEYNGRTVLVYFGDSTAYVGLPHGNRKRNFRQRKRTKPSVITDIKNFNTNEKPKQVHDKLLSEKSPQSKLNGVSVPRNEKQIKNIQAKNRRDKKLSHDALYGLHY